MLIFGKVYMKRINFPDRECVIMDDGMKRTLTQNEFKVL